MVNTLLFDLDDTLLWDKKSVKEALRAVCMEAAEVTGIDSETFEETVRETAKELYAGYESYSFTQKIGINPFEGLWGTFPDKIDKGFRLMNKEMPDFQQRTWTKSLHRHGIQDTELGNRLAARFPYHRMHLAYVYPETFDVLAELKQDYHLLLLTNGAPSLQNTKLEMTPPLVHYFDYIVISGAFGFGKPDPSIFHHALRLLDTKPEDAAMIGDNLLTDIDGANKAGIRSIWLNRTGKKAGHPVSFDADIQSLKDLPGVL
ncbi:HAD family hydrolase [Salibacterium halotolerans]|uniref:Phosphoserine phosphatase n=1 Tax=Salibacterium halotolerans TaxID=1884432 RepID=A0A1I5QDQ1_9BACI|nr:HAD family hydrolase [Salibacterium halotolerans]SFP44439.1 putative hydrolase of the HAD superfamily [Salibacterium halotolerans]